MDLLPPHRRHVLRIGSAEPGKHPCARGEGATVWMSTLNARTMPWQQEDPTDTDWMSRLQRWLGLLDGQGVQSSGWGQTRPGAQLAAVRTRLQCFPESARWLAEVFDFHLSPSVVPTTGLALERGWQPFAHDSNRGVFLLHLRRGHVAYLSVGGRGGCISTTLAEWLMSMLSLPAWQELLDRSGHGDLRQMAWLAPVLEQQVRRRHPALDEARASIRATLALSAELLPNVGPWVSAVERLHHAVSRLPPPMSAGRTKRLDSLFGHRPARPFVVGQRPLA